jgi:hypothetical protein
VGRFPTANDLDWIDLHLRSQVYLENMKFKITEPVFFQGAQRKPGDVLEYPTGPYRYEAGTGKRTAQFVDLDPPVVQTPVQAPQAQQTPLPSVSPIATQPTETKPVTNPAPGSFAAQIKAMMDKARSDVAKARTDALATVQEGIGEMTQAATATTTVAGTMARNMKAEAASILAELGQISNMPPDGEA